MTTSINPYEFNYRLLHYIVDKRDYFDNEFINRINIFKKMFKKKNPLNNDQYVKTGNLKNNNKNTQIDRMVDNYMIPLSYLVYGYIYTKYTDIEREKRNLKNNEIAFNMFKYFFDHKNPAIIRANAYYYLRFQKENEELERGNSNNIYLFDYLKTYKTDMNNFLDGYILTYINTYFDVNDEYENLKNIDIEFSKMKVNLFRIIKDFIKIKSNIKSVSGSASGSASGTVSAPAPASGKSNNKNKKIINMLNAFKNYNSINENTFKGIIGSSNINTKKIFDIVKSILDLNENIIINNEKEIINILDNFNEIQESVNKINEYILNLNGKNELLIFEDISINYYFDKYKKYNEMYNEIQGKKKNQNELIEKINIIKRNNIGQIELYEDLFKELYKPKTEKNSKKISKYFENVQKYYEEIIKNIYTILNKLSIGIPSPSNSPSYYKNSSLNKIETELYSKNLNSLKTIDLNIDSNDNYLNIILQLFLTGLAIEYRLEFKYLSYITNIIDDKNNPYLKDITIEPKIINEIQDTYLEKLRNYKKNLSNKDKDKIKNLEELQENINKLPKLNIKEEIIDKTIDELKTDKNILSNEIKSDDILKNKIQEIYDNFYGRFDNINKDIATYIKVYLEYKNGSNTKINDESINSLFKDKYLDDNTINNIIIEINKLRTGLTSLHLPSKDLKETKMFDINDFKKKNFITYINNLRDDIKKQFKSNTNLKNKNIVSNKEQNINSIFDSIKTKINNIENNITTKQTKLDKIQIQISKINVNNEIKKILENRKSGTSNLLNNIKTKIGLLNNKVSIEKIDVIKTSFNEIYESLIICTKEIDEKTKLINLLNSNNKLKFILDSKFKKIEDIYNKIISYKFSLNTSATNKNKNITDKNITDKNKNITELYNQINTLFKSKTKNNKKDEFINEVYKDIQVKESTNIIVDCKSFFDSYKKYYDDLIKSINVLLDKINNGDLILCKDKDIRNRIKIFNDNIIKQKNEKISSILSDKSNKNTKKGKTVLVLPYTDILYLALIYLLIIIDFLSYFYKPK
jgi:hypothetical protein